MSGIRRGIPASQLARDYGVSLNEFADSIIGVVSKEWPRQEEAGSHRREICAAVSATMLAAFDASTLSSEERDKLQPLIREVLLPFWNKHCSQDDPGLAEYISSRAERYLQGLVRDSRVKSAISIVDALLDGIETPAPLRPMLRERLVPAFAHRMVGDVYRINDVRRRHGIELSLLATLCALLQLSVNYDPVLRALRIV